MTPAILAAKKAKISFTVHQYEHDASAPSYGLEAAEKLGAAPERIFKTLIVDTGMELAVAIVPVAAMLNLKHMAQAAGAKKVAMADTHQAERATGYVLGGISPLGQKKRLKTFIDASAKDYPSIFVSAGRRGLEIELSPADLARLTGGAFVSLTT